MFTKIRNAFISGIAVILPVAITIIIIRFLFLKINSWILNPVIKFFPDFLKGMHIVYAVKAAVLLFVIFIICVIGWATRLLVIRKFFGGWEKIFLKVPMVGRIYNAIKQISSAFLGEGKSIFKNVVLIEYPRKGVYSIGFMTGIGKGETQAESPEEVYNVFLPTTPNPTSGIFLLVPKKEMKILKMSVEEGMKLIISGGAVSPSIEQPEWQ